MERTGDPAFREREDAQITQEPIREEERGQAQPSSGEGRTVDPSHAGTYAWPLVGVAILALAVVAGVTAGWQYAIPFAVLGGLVVIFFASNAGVGKLRQRRYGGVEGAQEAAVTDPGDSVPNFDFGERAEEPRQEAGDQDA